jgi:hypothetical protein
VKLRISILAIAVLASGSLVLLAMTKAELTEVLAARLEIEVVLSTPVNVSIPDVPVPTYEVVERIDPTNGNITFKTRGTRRVPDIKIRFPVASVPGELFEWHRRVRGGQREPHSGALLLIDEDGSVSGRFTLTNCWPRAWNHAKITRVGFCGNVVEEVCLACEDVEIDFQSGNGR